MGKILKLLKPYKFSVFMGLFLKFVESIVELYLPIIMADLITAVIIKGDYSVIIPRGLLMLCIIIFNIIIALLGQFFAAKVSTSFGRDLRKKLFEKVNSLSFKGINSFGTSSLINRITNDTNQVQNSVFMAIRVGTRAPFMAIGSFVMAILLDVNISMIFLFCIPIVGFTLFYVMKKTVPMYEKVQAKLDTVTSITRENFTGARVVRAFSKQEEEVDRFEESSKKYQDSAVKVGKLSSLINPVTTLVMQFGIVAILIVGGHRVYDGILEAPQITAFITYILHILLAMMILANLIVIFIKASASGNRIQMVFDISSELEERQQSLDKYNAESIERQSTKVLDSANIIEFKDVCYAYKDCYNILSGITFSLKKGESLGIIGGTGSGKTTLVNLLPRFYDATSGEIYIDGKNILDYDIFSLRKMIGFVPQHSLLIKGTIRENLAMGDSEISEEDMFKALEVAQAKFVNKYTEKLDKQIEQGGRNLSGGQRQRLTIARALVKNPKILILDDSSSALDYATDAALYRTLRREKGDMSIVMISQRVFSIKRADKILVLHGGKIAGLGTHDELLKACDVYRDIYNTQTK